MEGGDEEAEDDGGEYSCRRGTRVDANVFLQAKTKKNIETDTIGDKVGRIHMGRQDLSQLQTRKMKGLKRSRDVVDDNFDDAVGGASEDGGVSLTSDKKAKV